MTMRCYMAWRRVHGRWVHLMHPHMMGRMGA